NVEISNTNLSRQNLFQRTKFLPYTPNSCKCFSITRPNFEYTIGKEHVPEWGFDKKDWRKESCGLYFFFDKDDAINVKL
ncbi:MAG: hypothetical protein Satyrvirus9_25, partial [Satyrvirus sp.]